MISQFLFRLRELSRLLWIRAAMISGLAVLVVVLAPVVTPFIPFTILEKIEVDTVRSLLDILANSMLAVTTFSLTIMVTTHLTASQQVTPRAHRLLREDTRTQTVLATFIGAFVFSLTSIVFLQLDFISDEARPVLYVVTLLVVALVIIAIIRWTGHLATLGSVEETTRRVEAAAAEAIQRRNDAPFFGGAKWAETDPLPETGSTVFSRHAGFIQHIDTKQISDTAGASNAIFFLTATPGDWVGVGDALGVLNAETLSQDTEEELRSTFTIGDTRSFDQDPEFAVTVLAEIAERALSPSTNDPRTATDIIARLVTLFETLEPETSVEAPEAPALRVKARDPHALLSTAFDPIARDGAGFVEVAHHVQVALHRLSKHRDRGVAASARVLSARALSHAEASLRLSADLARVTEAAPVEKAAERNPKVT